MSFRRLVMALSFLAVFVMAARVSFDSDTWWHLRAGAWMVEHRQILHTDEFSLTRQAEPWIYPGWLAQLVLYGVFNWLSMSGLNLLTALLVTIAMICIWGALEGPPLLRASVLLLAAVVSAVYWAARPHIFSFALTGVFILILERARLGRRRSLWALPPLMALWVNLHGGFAIGFLLLVFYFIGESLTWLRMVVQDKATPRNAWGEEKPAIVALGAAIVGCLIAVCINPHGATMLAYPFKTVSIGVLQDYIQEWQSPDFHQTGAQAFLVMLVLMAIAMIASRRRIAAVEGLLVIGFGYMSFLAGRNIATFALVGAPILARHTHSALLPYLPASATKRQLPQKLTRVLNTLILALVVLAAAMKVHLVVLDRTNREVLQEQVPLGAISYVQSYHPPGPLFNSYNWGGYVVWALYPEYQSFVDGRTDLFGDTILQDYLTAWRALPGWKDVLDRWEIRLVMVETEAPLAQVLGYEGWQTIYSDEQAVVMAKEPQQ